MSDLRISPPADDWRRRAVIHQVRIRSFADADGDGIADIAGIRSRSAGPLQPDAVRTETGRS